MHSEWIFDQINTLKIEKKINLLDFASGNGRNCIPLSNKNIIVTAIDKDQEKLNLYKSLSNINTICFDLETKEEWPLVKEYYDIIIEASAMAQYSQDINNLGNDAYALHAV